VLPELLAFMTKRFLLLFLLLSSLVLLTFAVACAGASGSNNPGPSPSPTPAPTPAPSAPTVQLTANNTTINVGQTATLTVTSSNATQVVVTNNVDSTTLTNCAGPAGCPVSPKVTTIYTATATGSGGQATSSVTIAVNPAGISSVNHVIIMLQENRSFDSYFGKLNDYLAANKSPQAGQVEGIPTGCDGSLPNSICPKNFINSGISTYHSGSVCMEDMSPDWAEDRHEVNLNNAAGIVPGDVSTAPMDGFVNTAAGLSQPPPAGFDFLDKQGKRAMGFYTDHELNYYYFMAANFAISDHFFSPVPTNTPNNRMYLLGATSQGTIHSPGGSESCTTLGEPVQVVFKPQPNLPNAGKPIFRVLSENNISWKIYVTDPLPTCHSFDPSCLVQSTYLQFFGYVNNPMAGGTGFNPAVLSHMAVLKCPDPAHPDPKNGVCPAGMTDYFSDLAAGTLPSVALIETGYFTGRDEHPSGKDLTQTPPFQSTVNIQAGANFVSGIINTLMQSSSWKDSVFFWGMDEGGGAFDHVPPIAVPNPDGIKPFLCQPKDLQVGGDFTISGFRVPMMVISPFAKKNFVSKTPMDYTAILKFIETRWSLPNLTSRDASMPDMTEFFDFANVPWSTPPAPPPQTQVGTPCDFSKQ
jgi:phospholipase C